MNKKEKRILRSENNKREIKKITIDIAFTFLKIKFSWKERSRKRVPRVRSASEETVSIELAVISSQKDCKVLSLVDNLVLRLNS